MLLINRYFTKVLTIKLFHCYQQYFYALSALMLLREQQEVHGGL